MTNRQELLNRIDVCDRHFPEFKSTSEVVISTPDRIIHASADDYLMCICTYLENETSGLDFHFSYNEKNEIKLTPIINAG